jgi:hypothetical protein
MNSFNGLCTAYKASHGFDLIFKQDPNVTAQCFSSMRTYNSKVSQLSKQMASKIMTDWCYNHYSTETTVRA